MILRIVKKFIKKILHKSGYRIIVRREYRGDSTGDFARLKDYCTNNGVVKIHFGCGPRVLKGWVNIDLFYMPYEKYLENLTDEFYPPEVRGTKGDFFQIDITNTKLPLPDNSVDVVFHEDFIEHLSQRDQIIFLAETHRVLKEGGVHRVNSPDLIPSIVNHSDFSLGGSGVFTDEWDKSDHLQVLTKRYLEEIALIVGYKKIIFNERDRSISKFIPKEFRPSRNKLSTFGNIFADLVK